ncbi:MAG: hypothetical protein ACPL7K_07835, partial [Armatimonadota bacterium]
MTLSHTSNRVVFFMLLVAVLTGAIEEKANAQAVAVAPSVEVESPLDVNSPALSDNIPPLTDRRPEWLEATPEQRLRIAEEIGEEGARVYAKRKGYEVIFDGTGRTVPQGLNQVYRDLRTGEIVVIEAKGGTSPLNQGYGYDQGTPQWAVKAAEQMLRNPRTSLAEQRAGKLVIDAALNNKLRVEHVRTTHAQGRPNQPILEAVRRSSECAEEVHALARAAEERLRLRAATVGEVPTETTASREMSEKVGSAARGTEKLTASLPKVTQEIGQAGRTGRAALPAEEGASQAVARTARALEATEVAATASRAERA